MLTKIKKGQKKNFLMENLFPLDLEYKKSKKAISQVYIMGIRQKLDLQKEITQGMEGRLKFFALFQLF